MKRQINLQFGFTTNLVQAIQKNSLKLFEKDTNISLDLKQQIKKEEIEKEWDLEL